jgi:plasmid stabilization system protein ParE
MKEYVIFHSLIQRDVTGILRYYSEEAGDHLADRFYDAFMNTVDRALDSPKHFHPLNDFIRRATIKDFPYHFLYRETSYGIRVLVLRHHKRHPSFGMRRK